MEANHVAELLAEAMLFEMTMAVGLGGKTGRAMAIAQEQNLLVGPLIADYVLPPVATLGLCHFVSCHSDGKRRSSDFSRGPGRAISSTILAMQTELQSIHSVLGRNTYGCRRIES